MDLLPKTPGIKPWEQRIQFVLEEDNYKIVFQTDAVTSDELLEHFVQFMRGCGYLDDSIYESMGEMLRAHDDASSVTNSNALIGLD
jgi:hypothetical protein